jgi:glucosamine--fructose-6-phosphate aminotransferase (isomerizing)
MALVRQGYPVLAFSQDDETRSGIDAWVASLRHKGADVWVAEPGPSGERRLGVPVGLHPVLAPIVMVQRFHRLVHDVAVVRGRDPDAPPHLTKVTETF